MGMGILDRYRRIAGAVALVGTLFYSALIPLHVVSQATATLLGESTGGAQVAPCHEGAGPTDQATNDPARKAPATPPKALSVLPGLSPLFNSPSHRPIRSASSGSRSGPALAPNERGACRRELARAPESRPSHHPRLVSTGQNDAAAPPLRLGGCVVHRLTINAGVTAADRQHCRRIRGAWGEPCSNNA
jgi:hypothetical protein